MIPVVIWIGRGADRIQVELNPSDFDASPSHYQWNLEFYPPEGVTPRQYARRLAHGLLEAAGDNDVSV